MAFRMLSSMALTKGHDTSYDGVGSGTKALDAGQWEVVIMLFYVRAHHDVSNSRGTDGRV